MPIYEAPIADFRFLLQEVFDYDKQVAGLPGLEDATMDVVVAVLEGADEFVREVLLPINLPGDALGCTHGPDGVHTPKGYKEAYATYRNGGWPALAGDPAYGGKGCRRRSRSSCASSSLRVRCRSACTAACRRAPTAPSSLTAATRSSWPSCRISSMAVGPARCA